MGTWVSRMEGVRKKERLYGREDGEIEDDFRVFELFCLI